MSKVYEVDFKKPGRTVEIDDDSLPIEEIESPRSPIRKKIDDNAIELSAQRMSGSGKRTKEQEIDDIRKSVEEKVAAYKPDDEDENAEFTGS